MSRSRRGLRWRLTLWYTAALGGLLLALGVGALGLLDHTLRANVDASLASVAATIARSSRDESSLPGAFQDLDSIVGPALAERFFRLLDPGGSPDPRVTGNGARLPLGAEARQNAEAGRETYETVDLPGAGRVRLLTLPVIENGRLVHLVQAAMPLAGVEAAHSRFLWILTGLAPLALGGVALGGWLLVGRALVPVEAIVAAARRISAEDLSLRVSAEDREDEIGRLAAGLNDMLERLERSFAAARRFSADAAHELRTPLTILKGELAVALRTAGSVEEFRRALESCEEEVDRLSALVEDLLFLARADAGAVEMPWAEVDLSALVAEAEPALAALAERADVSLEQHCRAGVRVRGSEPMLFRVLFNVVENAIKYSGAGHRVEVSLEPRGGEAVLDVRDDGQGMTREQQQRAFERFYRSEPARSSEGAGLGLAIVRSVVTLHGGSIQLESEPGRGTRIRMTLPLVH